MDESQEAALVCRCQAGDTEAFRELIGTYKNTLFGVALLMTRDRSSAEDAVQEGLIKIWQHLPSLQKPESIKAWLVRIVVNEVKQQFRMKRLVAVPLDMADDIASEADSPEDDAIQAENRRNMRQALNTLPPEQRDAIILRFYSDLTVPEIATVMNQPQGTIKSRLNRGLARLNNGLKNQDLVQWWK
ncbi:RNA polymerase RpoN [Dehalogenimonas sp. WBC-2]|nr:RNA polymerase RpoN [Dehalogenimonas sp. WBC-2]